MTIFQIILIELFTYAIVGFFFGIYIMLESEAFKSKICHHTFKISPISEKCVVFVEMPPENDFNVNFGFKDHYSIIDDKNGLWLVNEWTNTKTRLDRKKYDRLGFLTI